MARRMIDGIAARVQEAVDGLEILESVKSQIECEVIPCLTPDPERPGAVSVGFLIGLSLPVTGGDHVVPFRPLRDPYDKDETRRTVQALYQDAQAGADHAHAQAVAPLNGHKMTPGGIALP
jgi:hypothetical protein